MRLSLLSLQGSPETTVYPMGSQLVKVPLVHEGKQWDVLVVSVVGRSCAGLQWSTQMGGTSTAQWQQVSRASKFNAGLPLGRPARTFRFSVNRAPARPYACEIVRASTRTDTVKKLTLSTHSPPTCDADGLSMLPICTESEHGKRTPAGNTALQRRSPGPFCGCRYGVKCVRRELSPAA